MSGREWKPGDVAVASPPGLAGIRALRVDATCAGHQRGPHWHTADGDFLGTMGDHRARPLVVIDPEDREQVERLLDLFMQGDKGDYLANLDDLQTALSALLTDPKPPEPQGLGAVVECTIDGKSGKAIFTGASWVFRTDHLTDFSVQYGEFDSVRVLSEGVS